MPSPWSIGPMGGSNAASEPLTSLPSSRSKAASAPIPVPEIPTRCTCMPGRGATSGRPLVLREHEIIADAVDLHCARRGVAAPKDLFGQRILQLLENGAPQGSCAECGLVAEVDELVFGRVGETNLELAVGDELLEALELNVHDPAKIFLRKGPEQHDVVDAIQELRAQECPKVFLHEVAQRFDPLGSFEEARVGLEEPLTADVARHDDDRVREVRRSATPV